MKMDEQKENQKRPFAFFRRRVFFDKAGFNAAVYQNFYSREARRRIRL
jgi:hypothetical protein